MQLPALLNHICTRQGWATTTDPDGTVRLELNTAPGRTQVVAVATGKDPEQDDIVFVWSVAGEAQTVRDPWALLRYSANLTYGALCVRGNEIVVKQTLRLAAADDVTLTKTIFHVGRVADNLEAEAYQGQDLR